MGKKILILSYSNLNSDPRVIRQIMALSPDYDVTTAGLAPNQEFKTDFIKLVLTPSPLMMKVKMMGWLLTGRYEKLFWRRERLDALNEICQRKNFDVVIANDIDTLPIAAAYKRQVNNRCKIYFDAHEYHPLEFEDNLWWRITQQPIKKYLGRKYLKDVDKMTTVSPGISEAYLKNFGVHAELLTNMPPYYDLNPNEVGEVIRLIHHGAAIRERRIELMIEMMDHLPGNFELTFMLVPNDPKYYQELIDLAKSKKSIKFEKPVQFNQISRVINRYDIGLFLLPPINFNYKHALPNKLFEFVQARLCIAIGPSPDMSEVVKTYDLGVVAADFSPKALGESINKLTRHDIASFKQNAHKAASELNAEKNLLLMKGIIAHLLK